MSFITLTTSDHFVGSLRTVWAELRSPWGTLVRVSCHLNSLVSVMTSVSTWHKHLLSVTQLCLTFWDPMDLKSQACQASLSTNSQSLLKLMSVELVMPSKHLILCHPLLLPPSIFPSIRVFSNESTLHIRWPEYWSFSFNISPSNEYSGLISFSIDWFNLLAVQGTLKSLLQHHSSKASILWCSAFFMVQISHPYLTTGRTLAYKQYYVINGKTIAYKQYYVINGSTS